MEDFKINIDNYYNSPIATEPLEVQGMFLNLKLIYFANDCRVTVKESREFMPEPYLRRLIEIKCLRVVNNMIHLSEVDKQKADNEAKAFYNKRVKENESKKEGNLKGLSSLGSSFWNNINDN